MHTCITYNRTQHAYTHTHTHTLHTIHQMKIYYIMIHLYIPQAMDSQLDSETLNSILENDIILESGGESDTGLPVPDLDVNSHEEIHTMKHFSILDELVASPSTHNSTNSTTSTTSSTHSHLFCFMITTIPHSTISTANPTFTLRHQPTSTTLSTPTTPLLHTSYNTSPSPINQNPPSTTTVKSKTTPPDTQSKDLPITFYFIPNCPNCI